MIDVHKLTNDIEKIADYYQVKYQEKKLIEELGELLVEISKNMMLNKVTDNTVSELADVSILIYQLIYLYDLEDKFIDTVEYKLARQVKRIEEKM